MFEGDSSIFLARFNTLRWFRGDLAETLWIEETLFAFPLVCICSQMLRSCGEPPSSSTSYPHTSEVLEDTEKSCSQQCSGAQKRHASTLPQLFITDAIEDLLSRSEYKSVRAQVPCSVSSLVSNCRRLTALVLPRRVLRRIVSSSQTSFPVRSKCLSASVPSGRVCLRHRVCRHEWVWDSTNVRALSFECFSDDCEVHSRAAILTASCAFFDQSIEN